MGLIIFSLIVSTVLLAIIYAVSRSNRGITGVRKLSAITTILFFFLMSPAVFLQSLLTLIIATVCCAFRWGSKVLMPASVAAIVEGGSKRRRRGSVGAVESGGAQEGISERWEDGGVSPYLVQLRREAQECVPTWSFGKTFVGRY